MSRIDAAKALPRTPEYGDIPTVGTLVFIYRFSDFSVVYETAEMTCWRPGLETRGWQVPLVKTGRLGTIRRVQRGRKSERTGDVASCRVACPSPA